MRENSACAAGIKLASVAGMMRSRASQHLIADAIRNAAASTQAACVLDTRGAYLFANAAWQRSESERRGRAASDELVGSGFLEQLESEELRDAWGGAIDDVLAGGAAQRVVAVEHNTPDVARLTSTRVQPITSGRATLAVVLTRTVVRERPLADLYAISRRARAAYADSEGGVTLCPCCRRARDGSDDDVWEIVPGWVAAPPATARWITCDLCAALHLGLSREAV